MTEEDALAFLTDAGLVGLQVMANEGCERMKEVDKC